MVLYVAHGDSYIRRDATGGIIMKKLQMRHLDVRGHSITVIEEICVETQASNCGHWLTCSQMPIAIVYDEAGHRVTRGMDGAYVDPGNLTC